jgi:hypothetical protein
MRVRLKKTLQNKGQGCCVDAAPRYPRRTCAYAFLESKTEMALDRDIFWVGRQWAVTGFGMQAVDQKQKGKFDIKASRVWENGLAEAMRAEGWLNTADFDKALGIARSHFPAPPGTAAPLQQNIPDAIPDSVEEPKPPAQKFVMRIDGWPAKFVKPWRIRTRR